MNDMVRQIPQRRITVDELLAWEKDRDGRYELLDGVVVTMQAERIAHAVAKFSATLALRNGIARAALPCRALVDGVSVRVDETTKFEPDSVVVCGSVDFEGTLAENPVIVVEVASPSSHKIDSISKLTKYFLAPTIQHYLIVLIDERIVIHHRRDGDRIATTICPSGEIELDPPGIVVAVADFFADLPEPEAHTASG